MQEWSKSSVRNDGTNFVVHIDEQRYKLILRNVFLALKNADPGYGRAIELDCLDTEEEAAVARWIAKNDDGFGLL